MKSPARLFTMLVVILASCTSAPHKFTTLTVMAAASLTQPFQTIGTQFEAAHPYVQVEFNFAGSQQLAQQIANAAPVDVFASASPKYMDIVIHSGRTESSSARTFATNRLVVVVPSANPARLFTLTDLARPGIKLVLAAREVPAGQYAQDFLVKAAKDPAFGLTYSAAVLKNVVSYESDVKAVLAKVILGEADAGIVYISDAVTADTGKITTLSIPTELNISASYPITAIQDSPNASLAKEFIDLVLSPTGQTALQLAGFSPPQ